MNKSADQDRFMQCFSGWAADRAQIPVGTQSLRMLLKKSVDNDIFIALLLGVFVVVLPLIYTVCLFLFVSSPDQKKLERLKMISAWSMLDVLALSLLITSIKGPSISIYISLGTAGYAFVLSIVLFKLVEYLSIRQFKRENA